MKKYKCSNEGCGKDSVWVRVTQFAGKHDFCEECAMQEEDFGEEDSYKFWIKTEEDLEDE